MEHRIGQSGLLRIAGCPIRIWLEAANPTLSAAVRAYAHAQSRYEAIAATLAERIGNELIPNDDLDQVGRRRALRLRRRLHRGSLDCESDLLEIAELADSLSHSVDLADSLRHASTSNQRLRLQERTLQASIDAELARVDRVALNIALREPSVQRLVRIRRSEHLQVALIRHQDDPRAHHYAGYIWEIVERAATRSTPRDWHGHVARLLIIDEADSCALPIADLSQATIWRENIHAVRRSLQDGDWPPPDGTRLSLVPLCWTTEALLLALTSDVSDPSQVHEVQLRRTPLLNAILSTIAQGAIDVATFERSVVSTVADEDIELIWGFVQHLVRLGVVQVAGAPQTRVETWRISSTEDVCDSAITAGFTDVYRRSTPGLQVHQALRFQVSIEQAQRVLAAIHVDQAGPMAQVSASGELNVPLLNLLREPLLHPEDSVVRPGKARHWPLPRMTDSAYAAIHLAILERAGERSINLDSALLDRCGAPSGRIDWPLDAILRVPLTDTDYLAVLDEMFPAGSMDARFITDLEKLGEPALHATAYRAFLRQIEEASGVTFVEVLVPPLAEGAANAVRRPLYTGAWTGDPDLSTYVDADDDHAHFIPLQKINVRRSRGRFYAEVGGQLICPMYHATRIPIAPWNVVLETLMSTAPLPLRWTPRRLHRTLDAFPDRDHLPRITTDGLILAGEQWRIDSASLWPPDASPLVKLCALERLRDRVDLPRWVVISNGFGKPVPCDLESVRAIRTIEQIARTAAQLFFIEMVPSPPDYWVSDAHGDALCSSIMLRLPVHETATSLATRIASQFAGKRPADQSTAVQHTME